MLYKTEINILLVNILGENTIPIHVPIFLESSGTQIDKGSLIRTLVCHHCYRLNFERMEFSVMLATIIQRYSVAQGGTSLMCWVKFCLYSNLRDDMLCAFSAGGSGFCGGSESLILYRTNWYPEHSSIVIFDRRPPCLL